jgi:hypothetical protein
VYRTLNCKSLCEGSPHGDKNATYRYVCQVKPNYNAKVRIRHLADAKKLFGFGGKLHPDSNHVLFP